MRNKGLQILALIALAAAFGLSAKSVAPTLKKATEFDLPGLRENGSTISR